MAAIVALGALAGCDGEARRSPAATVARPISRHIQLRVDRMHLGEGLPPAVRSLAVRASGDTVLTLPRGAIDDAERVSLHLATDGRLRGAVIDYAMPIDFEALIRELDSLGVPSRTRARRDGEVEVDIVTWQDARTTLRVRRDPNRSAWMVRRELWDR